MGGRVLRLAKGSALVLAGAVAATTLTGIAMAQDEGAGAGTEESQRGPAGFPRHPGLPGTGPVLHGENVVELPDGTFAEVVVHNGTITAVSASSITVISEDDFERTYSIDSDAEVRVDRDEATAASLVVGRPVRVVADADGGVLRIGSSTAAGEAAGQELRSFMKDRLGQFLPDRAGSDDLA